MFRRPLFRLLLLVLGVGLAGACAKLNSPLKLYFISSARFTSGSKPVNAGDTLSTRLYAVSTGDNNRLNHYRVTVTYSPFTRPFVYPVAVGTFNYSTLPTGQEVVYLDSALVPGPVDFLYTSTFGARTTSGAETWRFSATDTDGNTSARSFTLTVRRSDSTKVYHDYTLRLPASAFGVGARRFIDLKSGFVYPTYSLIGSVPNPDLQARTDLILLPDGARLAAPDAPASTIKTPRWTGARRRTRFNLTALTATTFTNMLDAVSIQQQFVASNTTALLTNLVVGQVYAFRTDDPQPVYGLLLVTGLPAGSTAGLSLQVRLAKQPL